MSYSIDPKYSYNDCSTHRNTLIKCESISEKGCYKRCEDHNKCYGAIEIEPKRRHSESILYIHENLGNDEHY